jgi:hypothetical protein
MPKRWIVTYAGDVYDRLNGANQDDFSNLLRETSTNKPTKPVIADEMSVNGGALVFKSGGEVTTVFGPTSYWLVELDPTFKGGQAAEQASESP